MLLGHGDTFEQLKNRAEAGTLVHANLFIGPAHVGKTKVAQLLSVFLQGADEHVILKKQVLEGSNADTLMFLDDGEGLSIETVRNIVERAGQSHAYPYLLFVIENVGRMKVEAANALLKTLEEPGEGVMFFLTANNEDDVLPTLRSRCHVTYFQTVPESELKDLCDGHVFEKELLFFSMGRPGKLKRLLDDPNYFSGHQEILQDLLLFLQKPEIGGVYELIRKYEAHALRGEMLDMLLKRTRTWAQLEQVETAKDLLKQNVNAKLVLENLLLPFVP